MSFSFSTTAGTSQNTSKPKLAANSIHQVAFDGCEIQDIVGVKDPNAIYKVLKLKFSNEDGIFEHTVFEPRNKDFERTENEITNKQGNKEKIPQPSKVESMMLLFKHAIDALVPTIAKEIDAKTRVLTASNWDDLRKLVASILDRGKGVSTKIKLVKNNLTNEAAFPGFFTGLNKDGVAYVKNNFIGEKVAFTTYEMQKITNEAKAEPTKVNSFGENSFTPEASTDDLDLNFTVSEII